MLLTFYTKGCCSRSFKLKNLRELFHLSHLCLYIVLMVWVLNFNVNSHEKGRSGSKFLTGSVSLILFFDGFLCYQASRLLERTLILDVKSVHCGSLPRCLSLTPTVLMFLLMNESTGKHFLDIFSSRKNNKDSVACVESAKKSPSERELKIIELSSCTLDLLSTCYTNSIIRGVKF